MVERNELITVCRQVGDMMEAGVDILRITRVLRAQTENPRLLQLYDALDHDMTMGHSLADAMSHAPDVFSPFMVLMVQQGEARNDLAGSFFKIANYLQKDGELSPTTTHHEPPYHDTTHHDKARHDIMRRGTALHASSLQNDETPLGAAHRVLDARMNAPTAPLTVIALDGLIDRLQTFALRSLTVISGLSLSLAGVWWSVEMGWLERRWSYPTAFSVAAIFMGTSGILIQRRIKAERRREARCSFCGRAGTEGDKLQRAPRFAGAAICSRCANIAAHQKEASESRHNTEVNHAKISTKTVEAPTAEALTVSDEAADEARSSLDKTARAKLRQSFSDDSDATSPKPNSSQNGSTLGQAPYIHLSKSENSADESSDEEDFE